MFSTSTRWPLTKALLCGWCALFFTCVDAQIQQSRRFEAPLGNTEPSYEVAPDDNGIFLHRYVSVGSANEIDLIRLDTGLNAVWRGALPIGNHLHFVGRKTRNEYIYFFLQNFQSKGFELYQINKTNGTYTSYVIKSYIRFAPTEFQITDEAVIIGGYFNRVPLALYYSFKTSQSRVLAGLLNEEGELTQVKTFDDGSIQLMISALNYNKHRTLWIKNYLPDGTLIQNFALQPDDNKSLIFGRSIRTLNDMQVVAGVYGNRYGEYSRGIFIATIDPNGLQQTRYYNYADLHNFFNYMKAKRTHRIKERIERRKIRGKKIKFNYRFLVHEIVQHNDQYVMLGEAFYLQYHSVSPSSSMGLFSPFTTSTGSYIRGNQVFDGYRYTHAVIIGFDQKGGLVWDNSFEINDVKTYLLEQYVKLEIKDDKIVLLYLFEDQIRTKIIQGDKVLEGKTIDSIRPLYDNDLVMKEGEKGVRKLDYWYGGYFYAAGVQNIINLDLVETPKRRVFFVNKIAYQ